MDEVAVVVLVAMMLSKELWTLMQESPVPASSTAWRLPLQWRQAQPMQSKECRKKHPGSASHAACAASRLLGTSLQDPSRKASPATMGPSMYTFGSVGGTVAVVDFVVVGPDASTPTIVHDSVPGPTAWSSPIEALQCLQDQSKHLYECTTVHPGSCTQLDCASSRVLTCSAHSPTLAALSTPGPSSQARCLVTVEVAVVEVALVKVTVVEMYSEFTLVQAAPLPAATMSSKLPLQALQVQSWQP